jgi:hypothetical protein
MAMFWSRAVIALLTCCRDDTGERTITHSSSLISALMLLCPRMASAQQFPFPRLRSAFLFFAFTIVHSVLSFQRDSSENSPRAPHTWPVAKLSSPLSEA